MAVLKHLSSKNANYGSAVQYLMFQHDSLTGRPLIEDGHLIMREEFLIDGVECSPANFDIECDRLNRKYHKNQEYKDIKSHHYIISFDPKDVTECGLTMEKAQEIGMDFTKNYFPGHQAVVCTHSDGENHSGNIHVHIVINSLRKNDVERRSFMERKCDSRAGYKHHLTNEYLEFLKKQVMSICKSLGLHQVDLLSPAKNRVTDKEQWAKARGQKKLDTANREKLNNGEMPEKSEFLTIKEELRHAIKAAASTAKSEKEFGQLLREKYHITLKVSRGSYGYVYPGRSKPIRGRMLGTEYTEKHLQTVFSHNLIRSFNEAYEKKEAADHPSVENQITAKPMLSPTPNTPETEDNPHITDMTPASGKSPATEEKPSLLGKLHIYQEISVQQSASQPEHESQFALPPRRKRIDALRSSAEAVAYLQENGYDSLDDLKADLIKVHAEEIALLQKITKVDKGINSLNEQLHYTGQYHANKSVYKEFVHSKDKDKAKFRAAHSIAIREYEDARYWLRSRVKGHSLPTYRFIESEEGKFPGPRTVRTVRDKEIAKRDKLRSELKDLKSEKTELTTILEKAEALIATPAIDETISTRKRDQQSL